LEKKNSKINPWKTVKLFVRSLLRHMYHLPYLECDVSNGNMKVKCGNRILCYFKSCSTCIFISLFLVLQILSGQSLCNVVEQSTVVNRVY